MPRLPLLAALLATTALTAVAGAQTLPTGGSVASGTAVIATPTAGWMTIQQGSDRAIVNWGGFSVGSGARVDIQQPSTGSAILNRVTGSTPSTIAGAVNANGGVYLVNPNGISITPTGQVNAAAFVASTLGITDDDFRAGRARFSGGGASAAVTNAGRIATAAGGYAALLGGRVENTGTISVPQGRVGLGAGERATLDLTGDGFLQVEMPSGGAGRGPLIRQAGTISVPGGRVEIAAATAREAARRAIDLSGVIEATSVSGRDGAIILSGGEGGSVRVTGRLDASSPGGHGGSVTVTGRDIALRGATIDASGAAGGGTVRVGGGREGRGPLQRADRVRMDAASTIRADATRRGSGGDVVVWSERATDFRGTIQARGGPAGGDGGEAEVSSRGTLGYRGTTDLRAPQGRMGTLLLDPYDITISAAPDTNAGGFAASGAGSNINATTLLTALGTANVAVSTGTGGAEAGNITVNSALSWTSGATLTLSAAGGITLNAGISAGAGGLTLNAGGTIAGNADVSVARFTLQAGSWVQNAPVLPAFATADFRVDGGSFLRAAGGTGTAADPWRLTDIYGLQGIGTSPALLAASFVLANNVDARGTAAWNGGGGFRPNGNDVAPFTGTLDGAGRTVTGLTIQRPSEFYIGLFGVVGAGDSTGRIGGVNLADAQVSGRSFVGALAGWSRGAAIADSTSSGSVTGQALYTGGLLGAANDGPVSRVSSTATVTGGSTATGGLIGQATGGTVDAAFAAGRVTGQASTGGLIGQTSEVAVTRSAATGAVTGTTNTGGLVGFHGAGSSIAQAYAQGAATGTSAVGGLVGRVATTATVTETYATGAVTAPTRFGGLVGWQQGSVSNSYWDTQTSGLVSGVGAGSAAGITGLTTAQARSTGSYTGFDFTNTWFQTADLRPILRAEAAAAGADGFVPVRNVNQLQLMAADLGGSYRLAADIDASATSGTAASGTFGPGGFAPVGAVSNEFQGTLDGAGRVVAGLTINRPTSSGAVGLFGYLGLSGIVRDIGLTGGSVTGADRVGSLVGSSLGTVLRSFATGTVTGANGVGGLVGFNDGTLQGSFATGAVSGVTSIGGLVGNNRGTLSDSYATGSASGDGSVGGLVGTNETASATIRSSFASGNVTGTGDWTGGFVGFNDRAIEDSYATGTVSGLSRVGGFVGFNAGSGSITRSYASGQVTGSSSVGGFAGRNDASVTGSFWDLDTSGQSSAAGANGGTLSVTGLTTAQARQASSYAGFDFTGTWFQQRDLRPILRSEAAAPGADGVVTIRNLNQLQLMATDLAGSYRLAADIDASATSGSNASGVFGPGGFVPVGTDASRFTGRLDGAGFAINGLRISRPLTNEVGLFGVIGTTGVAANLRLVGGSVLGSDITGALVGTNRGSIADIATDLPVTGGAQTGGLAGRNFGTITRSIAAGDVRALNQGGGLVGGNASGGSITQSAATGSVGPRGISNSGFGGLVAINTGTIADSYATGNVSGDTNVGGLVGAQLFGGSVRRSYSTGTVPGSGSAIGGLIGFNLGGTVASSVWNQETSGRTNGVGSGSSTGTTGLTTAQMQDLASFRTTYAGFDFATVWAPPNQVGQNNGATQAYYPTLYALSRVVAVTPAGSRAYGDGNADIVATFSGLRAGDYVTTLGTFSTAATAASGVGDYAATVTGTAASDPRYRFVAVPGTLTVTPRDVTISADAQSRAFGDTNPTLSYTFGGRGLANGDALAGALTTLADLTSPVGPYAITQGSLTSGNNPNYAITYAGADLTVTPRAITVTADPQSRSYGDANPALTYAVGGRGLVNGDALAGSLATGAGPTSGVGAYAITQGSLDAGSNYAITYAGADLTITPRAITVTADPQSRSYGDANPALTYAVGGRGLVNGDALTGTLATEARAGSSVGSYAILQGTLADASNPNYAITYLGADLTVTPRPILVSADPQSRIYGDANPALTVTLGGAGLVNGDRFSGTAATAADAGTPVGSYAIGRGTLSAGANYAITFQDGVLTILPRPLTITADPASRSEGMPNPPLTFTTGGRGLVGADLISGALATPATPASAPGAYPITLGTLTAGGNYVLTFDGADLIVVSAVASPAAPDFNATRLASTAERAALVIRPTLVTFGRPSPSPPNAILSFEDTRFSDAWLCTSSAPGALPPSPACRPAP
ncbi:MBG domain-containing protein [Roseomonas sp. CCTCC AB2023176]|uniref:MBG domain-containing protein n=1 Tax=Roseomonas sp. CCTCC AB2023176 TaxID=3342640 RepID=UPI0035DE372F